MEHRLKVKAHVYVRRASHPVRSGRWAVASCEPPPTARPSPPRPVPCIRSWLWLPTLLNELERCGFRKLQHPHWPAVRAGLLQGQREVGEEARRLDHDRVCRTAPHMHALSHAPHHIYLCRTTPADLLAVVTHRTAPHCTTPHRDAPHRAAPHRAAPHRAAPQSAPPRIAPHPHAHARTAPRRGLRRVSGPECAEVCGHRPETHGRHRRTLRGDGQKYPQTSAVCVGEDSAIGP